MNTSPQNSTQVSPKGLLPNYRYILASLSPRRRQLLADLDIELETCALNADESFPETLQAGDIALYLAEKKANAYTKELVKNDLLITADTIVWVDGQVLNKPSDHAHAVKMLQQLSGKTHSVFTGVCLRTKIKKQSFVTETKVTFATLSDEEINYYINTYKPFDKAGAYGVQEWIGYIGVSNINGSYFNVMGLPLHELYHAIRGF